MSQITSSPAPRISMDFKYPTAFGETYLTRALEPNSANGVGQVRRWAQYALSCGAGIGIAAGGISLAGVFGPLGCIFGYIVAGVGIGLSKA